MTSSCCLSWNHGRPSLTNSLHALPFFSATVIEWPYMWKSCRQLAWAWLWSDLFLWRTTIKIVVSINQVFILDLELLRRVSSISMQGDPVSSSLARVSVPESHGSSIGDMHSKGNQRCPSKQDEIYAWSCLVALPRSWGEVMNSFERIQRTW